MTQESQKTDGNLAGLAYTSVRDEALQLFSSVRTLAIGEFAAYLTILGLMFQAKDSSGVLALMTLTYGAVAFSTRMGQHWFFQAIRQNSYLHLAYELPEYRRSGDQRGLWILASRAEGFLRAQSDREDRSWSWRRLHGGSSVRFAGDLAQFLQLQLLLAIGIAVSTGFMLFTLDNSNIATVWSRNSAQILLAAILSLAVLGYVGVQMVRLKSRGDEIGDQWRNFICRRDAGTHAYLHSEEAAYLKRSEKKKARSA